MTRRRALIGVLALAWAYFFAYGGYEAFKALGPVNSFHVAVIVLITAGVVLLGLSFLPLSKWRNP